MAKILGTTVKAATVRVFEPVARVAWRAGLTPNMVTVLGTLGVLAGAIGFGARGQFLAAVAIILVSALTDVVDGVMARANGVTSRFGALLDSTMDRVADAAIFGSIVWWYAGQGDWPATAAGLVCLVSGQIVSYVRARAEGVGIPCRVGLIERAERLILVGIGALLTGLQISWGLPVALWLVAIGSVITIGQRVQHVYQADRRSAEAPGEEAG